MTAEELYNSEEYIEYADRVVVEAQELLDVIYRNNLLPITPIKELTGSICTMSLVIMSLVQERNDRSEIEKAVQISLQTICNWAEIPCPDVLNKEERDGLVATLIGEGLDESENQELMMKKLMQSACIAAVNAAYDFYNGFEYADNEMFGKIIEIHSGLNEALVNVLQQYEQHINGKENE